VTAKSGHDMGTISPYLAFTATFSKSVVPMSDKTVPTLETIIRTTLLCAARLFEVTACVYTSSVIRLFACRKSSCTVLMSSPFAFSNVPKEWRKVCNRCSW